MINKKQISSTINLELADEIHEMSKRENRTFSQTVGLLLQLAVKEKNRKRKIAKEDNT